MGRNPGAGGRLDLKQTRSVIQIDRDTTRKKIAGVLRHTRIVETPALFCGYPNGAGAGIIFNVSLVACSMPTVVFYRQIVLLSIPPS